MVPAVCLLLAALVARRHSIGDRTRSALQHFAAGVVFSTVAVELLPDVTRSHAVVEVVFGFGAGVALLLLIRHLTEAPPPSSARSETAQLPAGMLVAVGIDIFIDGLLVGLGFAVGAKEGLMVTGALTLELISLGLAIGSSMQMLRQSVVLRSSAVLVGGLLLGTALGASIVPHLSDHLLAAVLAFGCAALMFLVTEELLVEAHESGETALGTALFFVGFAAFLVVGMIA